MKLKDLLEKTTEDRKYKAMITSHSKAESEESDNHSTNTNTAP